MSAKLTKAQREILETARDKGTAFHIYEGRERLTNGGATGRCIDRLMSHGLISPMIGPTFGKITADGLAALSADTVSREG